jgi:ribosomal protein L35
MNANRLKKTQNILPTEATGNANILERRNTDSIRHLKESLPVIRCKCGAEILLVPDLQAMNRAVKTHVLEHKKSEKSTQKTLAPPIEISLLLSQLALIKASEENGT